MKFREFMCSIGFGNMKVDTVVETPDIAEGDVLSGKIYIDGGESDQEIEYIELRVIRRMEQESEYSDFDVLDEVVTKQSLDLAGAINSKETRIVEFNVVPDERWVVPTKNAKLILRTIIHINNGVDAFDEDEITYARERGPETGRRHM